MPTKDPLWSLSAAGAYKPMPFTSADTEVGLILTPDRTQRSCINAASMAGLAALSRDLWVAGAVVWSGFALGKEAAQNSYFGSLLTSFS